ncbi:MAG: radical SAM protein [Desulfobacteraceae bacterium]|nr:radical SAM protein [Desulfobacteraceae bacterium]MBC2757439.1 radical SAM protein [Desulfobacteraceae bacterium]
MNSINGSKKIGIEVKVTDRCNQNCLYCVNSDGGSGGSDIDHALFMERLREWRHSAEKSTWEINEVRITGGEPLLNESGTMAMINGCSSIGIISGINTNGSLLANDISCRLKDAGMKVAKISLDTLEPDMFKKICGSGASLENTLNGIRISIEAEFQVIIRFTLSRLNKHELVRCYEYATSIGASRFQVKALIAAGRGKMCGAGLGRRELLRVINDFSNEVRRTSTIPEILCFPPEEAFGLPAKACGSINKIYISTSGQVGTCNYLSGGMIGNISSQSLEDIFNLRSLNTKIDLYNNNRVLAGCPQYKGQQLS